MKTSTKLILAAAAISTLGLGGLAKLVNAAQTQAPVAVMPRAAQGVEKSDGDGETNDDVKEQQESNKLQSFAKINAQQAQQSAETVEKGKATSVKLENENGNLVYAVVIGQKEVKVDAGTARVLYTEALHHAQKDDKTDSNHPRSSVQVPQTTGDGDGETNDDG